MRIFNDFGEAFNEIMRDVSEMGTKVHTKSYQDKDISQDPEMETIEIQNYMYTVTEPKFEDLDPVQPWADKEWFERLNGIRGNPLNPGTAYLAREEIWNQFLNSEGKFAYTYGERFNNSNQVRNIIDALRNDNSSRQLFISMWQKDDSEKLGGLSRVPCSLGYLIQVRGGELHLTYFMRSCDFVTHFNNDVYLALKLQNLISSEVGIPMGRFTHYMASLHMFKRDAKGVF